LDISDDTDPLNQIKNPQIMFEYAPDNTAHIDPLIT